MLGARVWLRGAIEGSVTKLVGRSVTIACAFDLSLGSTTTLVVRGTVGLTPGTVGTDLAFEGGGSDLAELRALSRLMLPAGGFSVHGRFLRRADALAIEGVEVGVDGATVRGGGTIGEPPRLATLDLTVDASGPDLSPFSGIARATLPRAPFSLRGASRAPRTRAHTRRDRGASRERPHHGQR